MKTPIVLCLMFLVALGHLKQGVTGAPIADGPPKPVDCLVILDSKDSDSFQTAIAFIQEISFIENSNITVVSTDRKEPLLDNKVVPNDGIYFGDQFQPKDVKPLNLPTLRTILKGHFGNEDQNHHEAQIVFIITSHPHIEGATKLIEELRTWKTFIIAIDVPKSTISPVYNILAADDDHIIEVNSKASSHSLRIPLRKLISRDSLHLCNTDKYKESGHQYCSSSCKSVCVSTDLLKRRCKVPCPYYKEVNISAINEYEEALTKDSDNHKPDENKTTFILPIVIVVGLIILGIVAFCIRGKITIVLWMKVRSVIFTRNDVRPDPKPVAKPLLEEPQDVEPSDDVPSDDVPSDDVPSNVEASDDASSDDEPSDVEALDDVPSEGRAAEVSNPPPSSSSSGAQESGYGSNEASSGEISNPPPRRSSSGAQESGYGSNEASSGESVGSGDQSAVVVFGGESEPYDQHIRKNLLVLEGEMNNIREGNTSGVQ